MSFPNDKRWTKLFTPDDGIKCKYYDASVDMEMTYSTACFDQKVHLHNRQ